MSTFRLVDYFPTAALVSVLDAGGFRFEDCCLPGVSYSFSSIYSLQRDETVVRICRSGRRNVSGDSRHLNSIGPPAVGVV